MPSSPVPLLSPFNSLKGAVCRIELGIAVQIQNIGDVFFSPAPPPQI